MTTKQCPCGQEFTLTARNQWYCPACREAKQQAVIASRTVACRHCREVKLCNRGICAECREADKQRRTEEIARKDAAKLAHYNAQGGCKCGKPATNPDDGLCAECHVKRVEEMRQETRRRRRDAYEKHRQEQAPKVEESDDLLYSHDEEYGGRYGYGVKMPRRKQEPPISDPEQVAHEDQAAIDSAFFDLMDGVL